jgi:hypothetical protein
VFKGDWSKNSVGLTGFFEEVTGGGEVYQFDWAKGDYENAKWLTFPRPGGQGLDCVDPGPNKWYQVKNGKLCLHTEPTIGWPFVTKLLFPVGPGQSISFQTTVKGNCYDLENAWGGPVLYRREYYWRGVYFGKWTPGKMALRLWGPTELKSEPLLILDEGQTIIVRIDYQDGVWDYYIMDEAGNLLLHLTEDDNHPILKDEKGVEADNNRNLLSEQPPHAGFFMGDGLDMEVGDLDVYSNDPSLPEV